MDRKLINVLAIEAIIGIIFTAASYFYFQNNYTGPCGRDCLGYYLPGSPFFAGIFTVAVLVLTLLIGGIGNILRRK